MLTTFAREPDGPKDTALPSHRSKLLLRILSNSWRPPHAKVDGRSVSRFSFSCKCALVSCALVFQNDLWSRHVVNFVNTGSDSDKIQTFSLSNKPVIHVA